jgi:cytochrome oxidase assembly protein ShyY1
LATSPSGYFLVTVLRLANGQKLLVNRGWMPAAIAHAGAWDKPEVRCLLALAFFCCLSTSPRWYSR